MYMEDLGSDKRVIFLIKPVISVLQEAGGQLQSKRYIIRTFKTV